MTFLPPISSNSITSTSTSMDRNISANCTIKKIIKNFTTLSRLNVVTHFELTFPCKKDKTFDFDDAVHAYVVASSSTFLRYYESWLYRFLKGSFFEKKLNPFWKLSKWSTDDPLVLTAKIYSFNKISIPSTQDRVWEYHNLLLLRSAWW